MAEPNTKAVETQFTNLIDKLSRSQQEQERVATRLSKTLDELGKTAVDKLTKSLSEAAKKTGLLNDEHLALIKTSRDLSDAIEHQERLADEASNAQKKYTKAIQESAKAQSALHIGNATKVAEAQYDADLERLGLSRDSAKVLVENNKAFKHQAASLIDSAESLDYFAKNIDNATSAAKGWLAKTFTLTTAFELLKKSVTQQITELNKATAVGLQDSFVSIGWEAMKLKMTFEEFNDLIAKNRDIVVQLGAGATGIKNFSALINKSSEDLAYMGKDGIMATGRFIGTLKTMGMTAKDSVEHTEDFSKAMKSTQKHFKEFSAIYGDNYDQFADLIESQMMGEVVQSKLTGLNKTQAAQLREEIMLRTDNLKALGLTNDQIKDFGKGLDEAFNPHKNEQAQKMQQAEMFKSQVATIAQMQPENKDLQDAMGALNHYADMVEGGATPDQIEKYMSENASAFKAYSGALDKNNQTQADLFKQGRKNEALMYQYIPNALGEKSGAVGAQATKFGGEALLAQKQGLGLTGVAPQDVKATRDDAVKGAEAQDLYNKRLVDLRDVTQTVSAIMSNSLVVGLLGVGAGLGYLLMASGRAGAALDMFAAKAMGAGGMGGKGGPLGDFGGGGKGKLGGFAKGGALALGGIALSYAGSKLNEGGHDQLGAGADILGTTAEWAGTGAMIGSVVPGLGTGIGAAVGGGLGLAKGLYDNWGTIGGPKLAAPPGATPQQNVATNAATQVASTASASSPETVVLDELRRQTGLLATIAQNTISSFKPASDPRYSKKSKDSVANSIRS